MVESAKVNQMSPKLMQMQATTSGKVYLFPKMIIDPIITGINLHDLNITCENSYKLSFILAQYLLYLKIYISTNI